VFISNSLQKCILGPIEDLYISNHDDYGELFIQEWRAAHDQTVTVTDEPQELSDDGEIDYVSNEDISE